MVQKNLVPASARTGAAQSKNFGVDIIGSQAHARTSQENDQGRIRKIESPNKWYPWKDSEIRSHDLPEGDKDGVDESSGAGSCHNQCSSKVHSLEIQICQGKCSSRKNRSRRPKRGGSECCWRLTFWIKSNQSNLCKSWICDQLCLWAESITKRWWWRRISDYSKSLPRTAKCLKRWNCTRK